MIKLLKTEIDIKTESGIEKQSILVIKTKIEIGKTKQRYSKPKTKSEKMFSFSSPR